MQVSGIYFDASKAFSYDFFDGIADATPIIAIKASVYLCDPNSYLRFLQKHPIVKSVVLSALRKLLGLNKIISLENVGFEDLTPRDNICRQIDFTLKYRLCLHFTEEERHIGELKLYLIQQE